MNIEKKAEKERRKASRRNIINQDILKAAVFFAVICFGTIAFLVYFMVFKSDEVINNTYNHRSDDLKRTVTRGSIYSKDGKLLAYTGLDEDGNETRIYPFGEEYAHVIGFEGHGNLGLESAYDISLLSSDADALTRIKNEFSGTKNPGNSLITTLDSGLQSAACNALGGAEGSIIVMNPDTGEILAMVSNPGFDPNEIDEIWDEINTQDSSVLLNRATQGAATPGSTFKLFTLAAYLRQKGDISAYGYDCSGTFERGGDSITCPSNTGHGWVDIYKSFAYSCNCSFANMAFDMGIDGYVKTCDELLFNTELPVDIASTPSTFSLSSSSSDFMIMQTSFGQGETLVTPLHLALISCAVANGGVLMTPHIGAEIVGSKGESLRKIENSVYKELFTAEEAELIKECMRAVVTEGTGVFLSCGGNYTAYGKTGTAETLNSKEDPHDHSWFTGFAENNGQKLAVCAMINDTQTANLTGQEAAKQVWDYYFGY